EVVGVLGGLGGQQERPAHPGADEQQQDDDERDPLRQLGGAQPFRRDDDRAPTPAGPGDRPAAEPEPPPRASAGGGRRAGRGAVVGICRGSGGVDRARHAFLPSIRCTQRTRTETERGLWSISACPAFSAPRVTCLNSGPWPGNSTGSPAGVREVVRAESSRLTSLSSREWYAMNTARPPSRSRSR